MEQDNVKWNRTEMGQKYNDWLIKNNREDGNYSSTVFDFFEEIYFEKPITTQEQDNVTGGELKDYLVIFDTDNGFNIWTKSQYEIYVSKALGFGATPVVRVVTSFGKEDSFFEQKSRIQSLSASNNFHKQQAHEAINEQLRLQKENEELKEQIKTVRMLWNKLKL